MKTKLFTSGCLVLILVGYFAFSDEGELFVYEGEKMKGLSFVAPSKAIDSSHFIATQRVNAEWLSLMPYGFVKEGEATFRFAKIDASSENGQRWWGEQPTGVESCIRQAKEQGLKIMIKPHMWYGRGNYTGEFELETEAEWLEFETTFTDYILQYARLAEVENVALFCIATEMQKMVEVRPQFWFGLIKEIRKVYSGKLTYAENWDCFDDVPFWSELDYIGIDGYFPLSEKQSPDLAELKKGWSKHLKKMDRIARKTQKPILFTEYGYRSCDYAADKPWDTDYSLPDNEGLQARAYQSFFKEVWTKPWFAGGFTWKWFPLKDPNKSSRDKFCPQHKEAELVLSRSYEML